MFQSNHLALHDSVNLCFFSRLQWTQHTKKNCFAHYHSIAQREFTRATRNVVVGIINWWLIYCKLLYNYTLILHIIYNIYIIHTIQWISQSVSRALLEPHHDKRLTVTLLISCPYWLPNPITRQELEKILKKVWIYFSSNIILTFYLSMAAMAWYCFTGDHGYS